MPADVGPGRYDISRADSIIGKKRRDFCMSKIVPLNYGHGTGINGNNGFNMVGDTIQFDEREYN